MGIAPSWLEHLARAVGLMLHLAMGLLFLTSGLLIPPEAVIGLLIVSGGLLAPIIRWWRRRPLLVPLIPVAAAGLWLVVLTLGEGLLGWTA